MADNAFVKIGTALLKHQVKKLVGDETLEVIGEELADIGGDKLDAWLSEQSTQEELEKAAQSAQSCFREKVTDNELQQWIVSLPLGNLPKVVEAIDELPSSPNESKLENALRESITLNWKKLSPEQVDNAVNAFMSCLRSALLPIEKQTLMVIGRSVLRTEDKVDLLLRWFEQYIITGKSVEIKQLNPEPADYWNLKHPYAMPPNFTGRVEERKMLADWLNKDNENRLFILRALGGFGKSALSWHWLTHDVDSNEWKKVLWWSFYEGDASFEHFIEETLKYLKLEVPQGQRPQVDALLKAMGSQKILLIMDGFERALRAYSSMNAAYQGDSELPSPLGEASGEGVESSTDCVNLNAEIFLKHLCSLPNIKSKVLMTTRLTPRAVKPRGEFMLGCREVELTSMQPADAIEFFHKQKIKGTYAEIETACAPYGYHPLSLRLLVGRILKDFENPADIVVAQKLKIDGDIIQQKHHVLEVSYNSLPPHEQKLLSTIACFRSPVELKTLQAIAENKETLNNDLQDLRERGLLHFDDKNKKFDLHPIVRRYAYESLTAHDRTAAHTRLRDYFGIFEFLSDINPSSKVEKMDDIAPLIELYYHTIQAAKLNTAAKLYYERLKTVIYFQLGSYQTAIELLRTLFTNGDNNLPSLKDSSAQIWVLGELANSYGMNGQSQQATALYERQINLSESSNNKLNLAIGLGGVATIAYRPTGKLKLAELSLRRSLTILREIKEEPLESVSLQELGRVLAYCGDWKESNQTFEGALKTQERVKHAQIQSVTWAYRSLCAILMHRDIRISSSENKIMSIKYAERALELSKEWENQVGRQNARDFIVAYWLMGSSHFLNGKIEITEKLLSEALIRSRAINNVEHEADILLDLARLRYDQKNYEEAKSLADEALLITERCGYVLQGADVNLFLAQYALEQEKDKAKAKGYAEEALKLATCDGPPYYYKVAYEEAERMLEKL